jgi:hypothetical protein
MERVAETQHNIHREHPTGGSRRWRQRLLMGMLLFLLSTAFSIVVVEGFFRLCPGVLPVTVRQRLIGQWGVPHPYIGHLHTPNFTAVLAGTDFRGTFHTDGYGFRNSWPWPAQVDLVALGDSVTFGYGVDDAAAWPAILTQTLPSLRVLNLGLIGAGPEQYCRVYETFGQARHPRLVVVGFFPNDFWDAAVFLQWEHTGAPENYLVWRNFERVGALKALLRRHSYIYHLLNQARIRYLSWQVGEPRLLRLPGGGQLPLQPTMLDNLTAESQVGTPAFTAVMAALTRLQTLTREQGAQLLVLLQPLKEQVYVPLLGETTPDPSATIRAALAAQGITTLDLLPAFRHRAEAGEQLFFAEDGHPNQQGQQLIAQELMTYLTTHATTYGLSDLAVPSGNAPQTPPSK